MRYKGKIKRIDKIVISDPSYNENVWCRYERENINAKDWKINININNVEYEFENNIKSKGIEFFILMQAENENCTLKNDGSFLYYSKNEIEELTIGMDTACVAIGINETVNKIKSEKDIWQPSCSLQTLTDGEFGCVKEGKSDGKINFIYISGYLDEDTCYTIEDLIKYLTLNLEIEELEEVLKSNQQEDLEFEK